ncbi:LysR family transcriptional regulator [Pseudomonas sp. Marseille-QA0892]
MSMSALDLRQLRVFLAVVRHGGFTAAQQELNLSSSAISTYMSQLEEKLGFVICLRGRGGFRLTEKGEALHREALRLFDEMTLFERYTDALKGDLTGTLNVGLIDSTVSERALSMADCIGAFTQKHVGVHINLSIHGPRELQNGVLENRLDVAIGAFYNPANGLIYQPLYREQHWLYCSDRHPLFSETDVTIERVSEQRMVGRGYWSQAELARQGLKQSAATVESMEAQLILILSGGYLGYLPEHYAASWVEQGRLRAMQRASFGYQAPFSMIVRRGRSREPLIQSFRDLVRCSVTSPLR